MAKKAVIMLEEGIIFESQTKAEAELGKGFSKIGECCRGTRRVAGSTSEIGERHFMFVEDLNGRTDYDNIIKEIDARFAANRKNNSKPVMCVETGDTYPSAAEATRVTGISNIDAAARGDKKTAGGYTWKYI